MSCLSLEVDVSFNLSTDAASTAGTHSLYCCCRTPSSVNWLLQYCRGHPVVTSGADCDQVQGLLLLCCLSLLSRAVSLLCLTLGSQQLPMLSWSPLSVPSHEHPPQHPASPSHWSAAGERHPMRSRQLSSAAGKVSPDEWLDQNNWHPCLPACHCTRMLSPDHGYCPLIGQLPHHTVLWLAGGLLRLPVELPAGISALSIHNNSNQHISASKPSQHQTETL